MSDFNDQLNAFLEEVWRREAAAIEECAERILLSGTNWGMNVWRWFDRERDTIEIVVEPTPETRGIQIWAGKPTADRPDWRVCPNPGCHAGTVGGRTGFHYDYPVPCEVCDGQGWVKR